MNDESAFRRRTKVLTTSLRGSKVDAFEPRCFLGDSLNLSHLKMRVLLATFIQQLVSNATKLVSLESNKIC